MEQEKGKVIDHGGVQEQEKWDVVCPVLVYRLEG